MEIQADRYERIIAKIFQRIDEDTAFAHADFSEELAGADAANHNALITSFLAEKLNIVAYYHLFLVPHLMEVNGFIECLNGFAEGLITKVASHRSFAGTGLKAHRLRLALVGRVSYWKGMAMKRARTLPSQNIPPIPTDSPRAIIGRWLKDHGLKHDAGAREFGFDPKVLSALKRGTALKEHVCGPDKVLMVAQRIGCQPQQLDSDYLTRTSVQ